MMADGQVVALAGCRRGGRNCRCGNCLREEREMSEKHLCKVCDRCDDLEKLLECKKGDCPVIRFSENFKTRIDTRAAGTFGK